MQYARSLGMHVLFDRGTLVVADAAPEIRLAELPGVMWDPRTREYRAPAYRYIDLVSHLKQRSIGFVDKVRDNLRQHVRRHVPLRPYQQSAHLAWQLAGQRGIVALPTGSGKTRLALAAIAECRINALILVPTRVLLAQWCNQLQKLFNIDVGCLGDGSRQIRDVTVATFESAYRHMARIGSRFGLLVVDEVHHFGSAMREDALMMCTAPLRLGLTATPPTQIPATQRLTELVGPLVYELAISDLTGDYLADYDVNTLTLPLNEVERANYELDMARFRPLCRQFFRLNPQASWPDFVRSARRTMEGRAALDAWQHARQLLSYTEAKRETLRSLLSRHGQNKTLVFTSDNETAYTIASEQLVMPITCDIGRSERASALEWFRQGRLRALVSARVLNEGLDVPDADVAVIVGGGSSEREHVQRIGRLLRPNPGKRAQVYELVTEQTNEVRQSAQRSRGLGQPRCHTV